MIVTVGQWIIGTAAVVTACGVILRTRPARWAVRTLISDPLAEWFTEVVGKEVSKQLDARPLTNGWGAKAVNAIAEATGAEVEPPRREGDQ